MMTDSQTDQIDEQEDPNDFSLIHVSASDDDFLMASASGNPGDFGSHTNLPSHSVELPQPGKKGKCNLRKSLAWDSAFFTNAGVLDAEELSNIIEGTETSVKQKFFLPGIEEDVSKSYDSVSTFESGSLTLESLEADLFCDVRASIQRTSQSSAKGNSIGTKVLEKADPANRYSKKAAEISPSNVVKPKLPTKKLNPSVQPPSTTLKPRIVSKQIAKPPVRSKETKPMLPRQPEAAVKPSSMGAGATKKTSISASRAKLESNTSGIPKGKVASISRVPSQADSSKTIPKAPASFRFSSGSSVLGRGGATSSSRSSCDSSTSTSSGTIHKFASDINQRKTDKNVTLAPGSKIRAPSRVAVKSKSRSVDCQLSDYVKSTSQPSSISPTSSISEWSTESSSSTATINQCRKQPSSENDVSLSRPSCAKPSGLRMPSATIGFFHGVKAAAKTPSGGSRSHSALPSSLPRSGALKNTSSETSGKPQAVVKPDSRRTTSNLKPVRLYDPNTLNAENVDKAFDVTSKVSEIGLLESASEASGKGLNGGKLVADFCSGAMEDISLVSAKKDECPEAILFSSTNEATIVVEDLGDAMHITDRVGDLTEGPFSKEGESNRKEYSDIENVNTVCETSSNVLILNSALEENQEFLNEGIHAADSSLEDMRDINLVVSKKEAIVPEDVAMILVSHSPDVKLNLSTNQATIAPEDVAADLKTSSRGLILDPALEENEEFINEGKQGADFGSEVMRDINLVVSKIEASPDVKFHSLTNQATNAAEDVANSTHTVDSDLKTSSEVLILDPALEENDELLSNGNQAADCTSEVTRDMFLVVGPVAKKEASPNGQLQSATDQTTITVEDVGNYMHLTNCIEDVIESPFSNGGQSTRKEQSDIEDPTKSPFSLEGGSNKKECNNVEVVDTTSETSLEVPESILLDLAFEEIWEVVYEGGILDLVFDEIWELLEQGRSDVDSCSEAKKEAIPEKNLHSSTSYTAIAMHVTDCIEDLSESPSSSEDGISRKEQSDVASVDTTSETSSIVSENMLLDLAFGEIWELIYEGAVLDLAFKEIWELLSEGRNDADSCSEATKDINLVDAKKEETPEVNLHLSTNHTAIVLQDVSNSMQVTDCIEDPTGTPFSPEGRDNTREHGDLESMHTVSETSSEVSESILLELAFEEVWELLHEGRILDIFLEEIWELIYDGRMLDLAFEDIWELVCEGRNGADSCLDATVVAEKEATPEVKSHSSRNQQTDHAENRVDSFSTHVESTNDEMEVKRESNGEEQSHSVLFNEDMMLAAPKKEESPDVKTLTGTPFFEDDQSSRKEHSDTDGVFPSLGVGESENQTTENQDSGHETIEAGENNDMEKPSESNGKIQPQNLVVDQDNSSLLSPEEVSPETRSPFTIKNSVADMIKAYNKSAETPVRELVKSETLRSLEKGQKENC